MPSLQPPPGVGAGADVAFRVRTTDAGQTRDLAAALAAVARAGDRIALLGDLGAGKTQFAKGFAVGLGVTEVVNSPSFTLMAEYQGRLRLFHLDLYRLGGAEEILAGGLFDERQGSGVTLLEWAERLDASIDAGRLEVRFTVGEGDERDIEVVATDREQQRYVDAAAAWAGAAPPAGPRA
jgi:tRNA threonylcarbamoyladenosine biosynthesis protein TsaE